MYEGNGTANSELELKTIEEAVQEIHNTEPGDGKWFEALTSRVAPLIREWDILEASPTGQDRGIDILAKRRDGKQVAIQCKARQKDGDVSRHEINSLITEAGNHEVAESWLVTNGDIRLARNVQHIDMESHNIKIAVLNDALIDERDLRRAYLRPEEETKDGKQSKNAMQREAVETCVSYLRKLLHSNEDGSPLDEARGKLVLPCGSGKTRVALGIMEMLMDKNDRGRVSAVLCPSIALVAQLRREFLQHRDPTCPIRALAVCSDQGVGNPAISEEKLANSPDWTSDRSLLSVTSIKGEVTTDVDEIAEWMEKSAECSDRSVIFGTYQSADKIAAALIKSEMRLQLLVCDEAHRTAGITKPNTIVKEEASRRFTLCHDSNEFPARFRLYQTATPRVFDAKAKQSASEKNLLINDMDCQRTFGPELYRKSYRDAVENGWLADYRIIAIGVSDHEAKALADKLANTEITAKSRRRLGNDGYLKGLSFALALSQCVQNEDGSDAGIKINSCIGFLNTINNSNAMAEALGHNDTREWLAKRVKQRSENNVAPEYTVEHLDASHNLSKRQAAMTRLKEGTEEKPHTIFNVGIFGEGTDTPSLEAVSFLEPRKSPIDVVQAVGRVMRSAPGKNFGYIIVPVIIPPETCPIEFLMNSKSAEGWEELGQVLNALRSHDGRLEDDLLSKLYVAGLDEPESVPSVGAAVPLDEEKAVRFYLNGTAEKAEELAVEIAINPPNISKEIIKDFGAVKISTAEDLDKLDVMPVRIVTGRTPQGSVKPTVLVDTMPPEVKDARVDSIKRNRVFTKQLDDQLNQKTGNPPRNRRKSPKKTPSTTNKQAITPLDSLMFREDADRLCMNLLSKSGLSGNRVSRETNVLIAKVREAARCLADDGLHKLLDKAFDITVGGDSKSRSPEVAALILLNAAMLHQRIAAGNWLAGVEDLAELKASANPVFEFRNAWDTIRDHDFEAVFIPAKNLIVAIERTGKTAGLGQALRSVATSAQEIADIYAEMGTDHAGEVYNEFMGKLSRDSDGAFFTRPSAATLVSKLALDACGDVKWGRNEKITDLACGSGTLLRAALTEVLKRQGGDNPEPLRQAMVEDGLIGLDINRVSLQLAAAQLTAGTKNVEFRWMKLHHMEYGTQNIKGFEEDVRVGSLELFASKELVPPRFELQLDPDKSVESQDVWRESGNTAKAAANVAGSRLVLMNPPYSNRSNMGSKYPDKVKQALRTRTDQLYGFLGEDDMGNFDVRNSVRPMFVALADRCLKPEGVMAFVCPTIALTAPSGLSERLALAKHYHVHTILSSADKSSANLSAETSIHESFLILVKKPKGYSSNDTRVIQLDRFPDDENQAEMVHCAIQLKDGPGLLPDGMGEISYWPAEYIEAGNWSATSLRSAKLLKVMDSCRAGYGGKLDTLSGTSTPPPEWHGKRAHISMEGDTGGFRAGPESPLPTTTKERLNKEYRRIVS